VTPARDANLLAIAVRAVVVVVVLRRQRASSSSIEDLEQLRGPRHHR
jgi:hypothetical protein